MLVLFMVPIPNKNKVSRMKILDLGCGTGNWLKRCSGSLHGIDVSSEAIEAAKMVLPHARFVVGSAESLPYDDAVFDKIISNVAIPYMDIRRVFGEAARVLKDDGEIEFTYHPAGQVFRYLLRSARHPKAFIFNAYALLNGLLFHFTGRVVPFINGRIESFQTVRGLRIALASSGFEVVSRKSGRGGKPGTAPKITARKVRASSERMVLA